MTDFTKEIPATANTRQTIQGLDTIRFICAIWVVIGHFGAPPILQGIDKSKTLDFIVNGIYSNLWSGPSAVIIFFVISGFCIHYPQSKHLEIANFPEYFSRRYLRIGIPLAVAILLSQVLKINLSLFDESILWSLVAELIYYTIYPVILKILQLGISWRKIFTMSFIVALLVAATNSTAGGYPSFGMGLNWLLGLPCWLLGVKLAECHRMSSENVTEEDAVYIPKLQHIWLWRITVWGASAICSVLRFHSPIGYPWTLNVFAILVFFWLMQEIRFYKYEKPSRILEWGGKWSYSIYLIHLPAQSLWLLVPHTNLGYFVNWLNNMLFILLSSYVFAILVEFPSHKLSRIIGKRIGVKNHNFTA